MYTLLSIKGKVRLAITQIKCIVIESLILIIIITSTIILIPFSFHKALIIQCENDQRTRKHDLQQQIELIGSVQSMEEKMKQRHGNSFQIHKRLLQRREPSIFCIHDG